MNIKEFEDGRTQCSCVFMIHYCTSYACCVCVCVCACACACVCCVGELIGIPVYSIRVVSDCDSNKLFLLPFLVFVTLRVR